MAKSFNILWPFFAFLELELNVQSFGKKIRLIAKIFLKLLTPRDVLV